MNSNQWFGIFIAVIMIGSILGFALMFSGNQPQETPVIEPDFSDSTVMQMNAENINAKVIEVLPKVLFSAYTNEADIMIINEKIASVEGIYSINSKYRQSENTSFGTSLVFISEISFAKEKSIEETTSAITSSTEDILFDPAFFQVVLISVPKNVKFSNEQGFDLDYEYEDPLTTAYVLPGTLKGDELSVRIDASFTGNTMVNSFASVSINLTAEPKTHSFELTKTVEEKLPRIVFGSFADYSDFVDDNSLKEQILSLANTVDANIASFEPENYFTVFFEAETDLKEEFTKFINDNNASFTSIEVFEAGTGFSAQIYFKGEINTQKALVEEFLKDKNASDISFSESLAQVFASISLASPDSSQTVSDLNGLLNELNFKQTQIQQEVVVVFDSFVSDEGIEFIPDEQTVTEVFVSPSTEIGQEVDLAVEIETARDSVVSIRAASE